MSGYIPDEEYQGGKHSENKLRDYSITLCFCPICREYQKRKSKGEEIDFNDIIETVKEEVAKDDNNVN